MNWVSQGPGSLGQMEEMEQISQRNDWTVLWQTKNGVRCSRGWKPIS